MLVEDAKRAAGQIAMGEALLNRSMPGVVQYRHRRNYGEPLYSLQFKGCELKKESHLGECLFWRDRPEMDFPDHIRKSVMCGETVYRLSSRHSCFTNNPVMYNTSFLHEQILPFCSGNLEDSIQSWWEKQDFPVYHEDGLFMHLRLDRLTSEN